MYAEITETAFMRLVDNWIGDVVETELTKCMTKCRHYYDKNGVQMMMVHDHNDNTWQYYIQDINS